MLYDIGKNPGRGIYQCVHCGDEAILIKDEEKLPHCPNKSCADSHPETQWRKVD